MRTLLFNKKKDIVPLSVNDALPFLYDYNFSKRQYFHSKLENKERNCDIYLRYEVILEGKRNCRPSEINITETTAEVSLQNLLEHTAKRISLLQTEVIDIMISESSDDIIQFEMICSLYKQRFEMNVNSPDTDSSLFITSVIPLRLKTINSILWNDNTPGSVRFCRPLKLQYIKET